MTPPVSVLRRPDRSPLPWGDYGSILVHGMSLHLPRIDGIIQLERTGPYIPPVTFPGVSDIVVTDAVKRELEIRLPALHFLPLIKKHIVRLDWQNWDPTARPAAPPITGEPEDYILKNPHDERAATLSQADCVPLLKPSYQNG